MIGYLARKYMINSALFVIALAALPALFGEFERYDVHRAVLWGSFFGAAYTYRRFHMLGIWPLYDNLLLSRLLLLGSFFGVSQVINVAALIVL